MKKNIIKAIIAIAFVIGAILSFNVDVKANEGDCGCDPECNHYCKCGDFQSIDYRFVSPGRQ